jgi:hypothetical protein
LIAARICWRNNMLRNEKCTVLKAFLMRGLECKRVGAASVSILSRLLFEADMKDALYCRGLNLYNFL